MMLYKNMKVKVCSPDGDTDYFDIVAGVLQGDSLAPYLFIICQDYVLRTSIDKVKDNGFKLTKEAEDTPTQTITYTDYTNDIALLANTPTQAKTLPHSLEQAAASIDFHVNADKTEYICFNQRGDISTLNGNSLKLVVKFTYLVSSVSSTETDINMQLAKAWTAIDRLSVIWKSDLTDKIKCTTWMLTKHMEKKLDGNYTRKLRAILNNPGGSIPQSARCTATYHPSQKLSKLDKPGMQETAGEIETNS